MTTFRIKQKRRKTETWCHLSQGDLKIHYGQTKKFSFVEIVYLHRKCFWETLRHARSDLGISFWIYPVYHVDSRNNQLTSVWNRGHVICIVLLAQEVQEMGGGRVVGGFQGAGLNGIYHHDYISSRTSLSSGSSVLDANSSFFSPRYWTGPFAVQWEFVSPLQVTHLPFNFPWNRHQIEGTTGF